MVGAPGSSKACITCRRRKKGCDLQQPKCNRCLKGGFSCEGYDRDLEVIQRAETTRDNAPTVFTAAVDAALSPPTPPMIPGISFSVVGEVALFTSLARSAYKNHVLSCFWECRSIAGRVLDRDTTLQQFVKSWMPAAQDIYHRDPALQNSLLALCLGSLGRIEDQNSWLWESQRFYMRSLEQMNVGLKNSKQQVSNELLLTSKALIAYELLHSLDDNKTLINPKWPASWLVHQLGQMSILLQRTPEMHIDGHAHSLFVEGRLSMITVSILRRKRYPFNDMRWKTIPWLKQAKSPQDLLIDILGEVPGLLEDTDTALLHEDSQKAALLEKVLGECWKVNDQLKWWLENLGPESLASRTLQAQELPSSSAANDTATGHKMCIYWAAHLLIHATIWLILHSNQPRIQRNENDISHQTYPVLYCRNIIETARGISNPLVDGFVRHPLSLPLGVTYMYLKAIEGSTTSLEILQLVEFFDGTDQGLRMRRFFYGMMCAVLSSGSNLGNDEWDGCIPTKFQMKARAWFRMT